MASLLVTFAGVAFLASLVPGPDTAVVVRNTIRSGRAAGLRTAVGCSAGQLIWGAASLVGIAAVLATSAVVFSVVKFAGAAYLLFLGVSALIAAYRGTQSPEAAHGDSTRSSRSLREGLLTNVLNPKTGLFMTALLPQFLEPTSPGVLGPLLVVVTAVVSFGWMSFYAVLVAGAGDVLRRPRVQRTLDALIGTVLVALGLRLVVERR